jgi:hypothetical protein
MVDIAFDTTGGNEGLADEEKHWLAGIETELEEKMKMSSEENQRRSEGVDQQQNIQLQTTTDKEGEGRLRRDATIKQMH